ncbi:RHS repeat-associated core domain-containing protein, partial [Akkermansia sp. BIOML-A8]
QGINGVQTVYTYEATTDHGALHKVTSTVQAKGSIVPGQSTRSVEYIAQNGTTTRMEQYVHTGENWSLISSEDYQYDAELKLVKTTKANGRTSTTEWMCCGPLRETDEDGITTSYAYNSAKQLVETIRSATETTPETITSYMRDAKGHILSTRRDVGSMTTVESTEYDDLGRVISATDILGRVTRTQYSDDQLTTTVTTPSGSTLITKTYYDDFILLQTGTGQREIETQLELTQEGILTTTLSRGVVFSRTLQNGFGQTIRQEQPNTLEGFIVTSNTYNSKGQLICTRTEDMAPAVTEYNELGQTVKQTVLLDQLHPGDPAKNRISESSSCYQIREDGIYQVQTSITYNAEGLPLTQTAETMVSQLNPVLESKTIATDVYGQQSVQWTEYTAPTKRTRFSRIPTSDIVAESLVVDGFGVSQTDHAGICSSQERSYTSAGMIQQEADARGNVTAIETDLAGRPIRTTDAQGNITLTAYSPCCDAPSCITNALGGTTCYSYDIRGRKIAEYGTAVQPSCFAYDEAGRLTSLTTFRANEGDITTDPSNRTDGDTTTWLYDTATGLELKKTYADGSCVSKTYDRLNRLKTLTRARGIVTTYQYAPATGELVSVSHSDNTQPWLYSYNHLGQMITVSDALGTREFSYDAYGRSQQDTSFGTVESSIQEKYDSFGRPCGYRLMIGTRTVQYSHLDYDHKDAIIRVNLEGLDTPFTWEYDETSSFLKQLSYPNGMVRRNTYHPRLNLLASIGYEDAGTGDMLAGHVYQYDNLMRPIQRRDSWDDPTAGATRNFTYNGRSELTGDQIQQRNNFAYQYDNIGNRKISRELEKEISYGANELNQYTNIIQADVSFDPLYDADGNQTRIRTSTGIWNVCYDANDRPVSFTSEDGRITVTCGYDYQGRRFEKKVAVSGAITSHVYYLYRGYLQVAELNMMHPMPVLEKSYWWDPTEPTATRILMMTRWKQNGKEVEKNLYFTHDALKNVTSIFDEQQARRARYEYAPFGALITAQGDMAQDNRFRFSCECMDDELGLVYYNYRHLNLMDGRWINRDPIAEQADYNLYRFVNNSNNAIDFLGMKPQFKFEKRQCSLTMQVKLIARAIPGSGLTVDQSVEIRNQMVGHIKEVWNQVYTTDPYMIFPKKLDPAKCPCCNGMKPLVNFINGSLDDYDLYLHIYKGDGRSSARPFPGYGHRIFPCDNGHMKYYPQDSNSHLFAPSPGFVPAHEFGHGLGLCHPGEGKSSYGVKVLLWGNRTVQAPYVYEGKDLKERLVNGREDLMGVGLGLRDFYFERWQQYLNQRCPDCEYFIKKAIHLASFIGAMVLIFSGICGNVMAEEDSRVSPFKSLEEDGLLPPMQENEDEVIKEIDNDPVIFGSRPSPLPLPYNKGVKTLTAKQASKHVFSIIPHWTSLVTWECDSLPGVYTEVISPPALCSQTRVLLKRNAQSGYAHQWRVGYMKDGKEHVLDLFTTKNQKGYSIKLGEKIIPCNLAVGTIQQGRSSMLSFGLYDMYSWFHEYEDGRTLIFITYRVEGWYGELYFSNRESQVYYHGSLYVSEEAAASM